ncbi:MAG: YcxB family protein [Candidatus Izemoplasmatales bacterium]
MNLNFKTDNNDLFTFKYKSTIESSSYKNQKLLIRLLVPILVTYLFLSDMVKSDHDTLSLIISTWFYLVIAAGWFFIFPIVQKSKIKSAIRKSLLGDNSNLTGETKVSFDNENLKVNYSGFEIEIKLANINKTVETENYLYLYYLENNAIIIPKYKMTEQLDNLKQLKQKINL